VRLKLRATQRGSNADPSGRRDLLDCRSLRCSLAWSGNPGLLRRSKPTERGCVCAANVYWFSHPNLFRGMVRQVRHFRQEEHHWTLNPNKRQLRTAYGLARELDATDEQRVPPFRSHLPEAHICLKPAWKTSAQNAIEKINNPAAKRRSDRTLWSDSSS
jgi:hypothetical protein